MKKLLWISLLCISCSTFLKTSPKLRNVPVTITVLTASTEGLLLSKKEGRYFSNKLTEYLFSDSTNVIERSLINAYEKAFQLEGRSVYTPKEFQEISTKFPSDYYIISHCKEISKSRSVYEIQLKAVNANFETKYITSLQLKNSNINELLNEAAKRLSNDL